MKRSSIILSKPVSAARVCIVILGAPGVGKTALLVRYLTRRYIGEYLSGSDIIYQQYVPLVKTKLSKIDFLDTSTIQKDGDDRRLPQLNYKTISYIVVYSVLQQDSFTAAERLLAVLPEKSLSILLANKSDLEHRRRVSAMEGQRVAKQYCNSSYFEVTAAEECSQLTAAFNTIIRRSLLENSLTLHRPFSISIASKLLKFIAKRSEKRSSQNARKLRAC